MKPKLFCFVTITAVMSMMGTNEVKLSLQEVESRNIQAVERHNILNNYRQPVRLAELEFAKAKAVGTINELKAKLKLLEALESERDFNKWAKPMHTIIKDECSTKGT